MQLLLGAEVAFAHPGSRHKNPQQSAQLKNRYLSCIGPIGSRGGLLWNLLRHSFLSQRFHASRLLLPLGSRAGFGFTSYPISESPSSSPLHSYHVGLLHPQAEGCTLQLDIHLFRNVYPCMWCNTCDGDLEFVVMRIIGDPGGIKVVTALASVATATACSFDS